MEKKKQQHTFSILDSNGVTFLRKGRNIYKYLTLSKTRNKDKRKINLKEKYERGSKARQAKKDRIDSYEQNQTFF